MKRKIALFIPYLAFFSLPLVAITKGKGIVITLVALSISLLAQYRPIPSLYAKAKEHHAPLFWAILCLIWCGLSIFWSEAPLIDVSLRYIRLIILLCIGGIGYTQLRVASTNTQFHFRRAFVWGYTIFAVFCMIEVLGNGIFFYLLEIAKGKTTSSWHYNPGILLRGIVILAFLLWPYLAYYKKKSLQICTILGCLWLIYGLSPDAAFVGMLFASFLYFAPLLIQRILLSGMLIGGILTPWISKYLLNESILFDYMRFIPTSHQHRIFMWEELSNHIFQAPILGHGFDFSSFIKSPALLCNHYTMDVAQARFPHIIPMIIYPGGAKICDGSLLFGIHPHNGFLQVWLELGAVGIFLLSIFAILFYRLIQHNRIAVAMFGFYAVIFSISFNIWQNWMISTLWLGAMCLFVVNHRQQKEI